MTTHRGVCDCGVSFSYREETPPRSYRRRRCCRRHDGALTTTDAAAGWPQWLLGTLSQATRHVRVAVDTSTKVGNRMVRVLLSESGVSYVGVLAGGVPNQSRSGPVEDLASFDVVVSDGTSDLDSLVGRTSVAGIPLVLWTDLDPALTGSAHTPVIFGANVATALTAALLTHPVVSTTASDSVRVGWTEPGKPKRRGEALHFPEPIGSSWAKRRSGAGFVAFRDDEWAGAVVDVQGETGRRIVGVADHGAYIEAITLAAVALLAAEGAYGPRFQDASTHADQLLNKVTELELEVAAWRSTE